MSIKKTDGLEIEEEATRIETKTPVKKLGKLLMLLPILLGIFGLTEGELFGKGHVLSPDKNIEVFYPRFGRYSLPENIDIIIGPKYLQHSPVIIWFSQDYLRKMYIKQIVPQPTNVRIKNNKIIFSFAVAHSDQPITISFLLDPDLRGLFNIKFGVVNAYDFLVKQFIYP